MSARAWRSAQRVRCSCPAQGKPGEGVVTVAGATLEVLRDGAAKAHACSTAKPAGRRGRPPSAPAARLHARIDQRLTLQIDQLAKARGTTLRPVLEQVIAAGLATPELAAELARLPAPRPAKARARRAGA